ncbi:MAG: hypothetical protein M1834_002644 [Cirrosporium novae-zelandiae]|nr:MAG: hypothetical protein M1834_002644 [Cirrosporium novae-zelandiae]
MLPSSKSQSFTQIPLLDLSLASSPQTRPALLGSLHDALITTGFLLVENHGVPANIISDLINVLPELFRLGEKEKEEVALVKSSAFLGWSGVGEERTGGRADWREQFEFGTADVGVGDKKGGKAYERLMRGVNQWPSAFPQLRPIVETYLRELTALSERFLELVAEALNLPPSTFFPFLSHQHRLKLAHYAPVDTHDPSSNQGVGPHKDSSGWWTFLLQASPPEVKGLQALNKAGDWIDVPVIPGTFVVNIGQAFEVVTNGVCKATTHRVLSGPWERYSVPFFQGVRGDLTKKDFAALWEYFGQSEGEGVESEEGSRIDSAFLRGKYDTWGESQLRTKIRSHPDVGRRHYAEVFEKYINDD